MSYIYLPTIFARGLACPFNFNNIFLFQGSRHLPARVCYKKITYNILSTYLGDFFQETVSRDIA